MLKVVFFNHAQELGGAELSLLDILKHLDRSQFQPALVAPGQGPLSDQAAALGVVVKELTVSRRMLNWKRNEDASLAKDRLPPVWESLTAACRLAVMISPKKADVLYTNSQKAHIIGGLAGRLSGVPVIWHLREIMPQKSLHRLSQFLSLWLPSKTIAVSDFVAEHYLFSGWRKRPCVIRTGVDGEDIRSRAREETPTSFRKRYQIPAHTPLVGMVSRIAPGKGQHIFLHAARKVLAAMPRARFIIIGDSLFGHRDYHERILKMADKELSGRVIFTGYLRNPYPAMASLDVMVNCSLVPEGLGRSLIEAMLLGRPVVAARGGGAEELIEDGRHGLLVEPGDAEGLAKAIMMIIKDSRMVRTLTENAKIRAEQEFSLNSSIRMIEKVIKDVTN